MDTIWGSDLTATFAGEGRADMFGAEGHCPAKCIGIAVRSRAARFEAPRRRIAGNADSPATARTALRQRGCARA